MSMTEFDAVPTDVTLIQARDMVEAIRDGRLDEAEALLDALRPLVSDPIDLLVFPVVIAIQRGRLLEALDLLDGHDERQVAPLRALCLHLADEPSWEGLAREAMENADPCARRAMRQLCGLDDEEGDTVSSTFHPGQL